MTEPNETGDFEYDLAHDGADTPQRSVTPEQPVQIVNTTPDQGEDYSYDLAHDIPPQH